MINLARSSDLGPIANMLIQGYAEEFGKTYSYDFEVGMNSLEAALASPNQIVYYVPIEVLSAPQKNTKS